MFQDTYYIGKSTGTFADNLMALGLAFVLDAIAKERAKVQIEDRGDHFAVTCKPALHESWVVQCPFFVGAPMLITFDNKSKERVVKGTKRSVEDVEGMPDIAADYEQAKRDSENYWEWRRGLSAEDRKRGLKPPVEPHPDWDLFRAINPSALQSYNAVLEIWYSAQPIFADLLRAILIFAARLPNDESGARSYWKQVCKQQNITKLKQEVTALQLLNPSQGKGINAVKATFAAPANVKAFWLIECLKIFGLRHGGITKQIKGAKDRKTYVLSPKRLDWNRHQDVMREFKRAMIGTAGGIQLDALVVLRYTQAVLRHSEEARPQDLLSELFGAEHGVSDFVSGMDTAFYKNLGQQSAAMNIARIGLPRWVRPRSPQDLMQLRDALDEHIRIVRALDETRGEQFDLLCKYRDFLSASDIGAFFEFTDAYSGFVIQREKLAPQFTVKNLEVLMNNTEPKLSKITQSQGFRNLAYAIRMATVEAQRRSLKKNQGKYAVQYETRYGLGPELVRKSAYPNEFIIALSEFIQSYNAENARMRERTQRQSDNPSPKGLRSDVSTQDIDELLALMDEFGDAHMIASMLVAYGYASTYQRKDQLDDEADADEDIADTSEADEEIDSDEE
ncbi:MAG: hypothetical protein ACUVR3_12610 [Candidatus Roseilinea sp.]|uniref:hypothetical protein n=1 Tax=Candidatus Roseilinea sp. TaxID=2838777 RepID=UPI00404B707A